MACEDWILSHPWRSGKPKGTVVCDAPPVVIEETDHVGYYGGLLVLESCTDKVRSYLLRLHNTELTNHEHP